MKYVVVDFRKIIANNGSNLVLNIAPLCDTIILNDSQIKDNVIWISKMRILRTPTDDALTN